MTRDSRYRAGMTLLEMVVYIAIFSVIINTAAMLFIASMRVHGYATAGISQRYALDEFHRDFQEMASGGIMPATQAGDYTVQPGELLVLLPGDENPPQTSRYALWRLDDQKRPTLQVFALKSGSREVEFHKTYSLRLAALEVDHRGGLVSLGLLFEPKRAGAEARRYDFAAALRVRGDT